MLLRASLARSLQYAMANMADIKTPLCALQPTPAIPHTASRSGAGTRGGGGGWGRGLGEARARMGAGPERASRQPRRPPARRARLLAAPAFPGAEVRARGRRGPRPRPPLALRSRSLSHARSLPAPRAGRRRCRASRCTLGLPKGRGGRSAGRCRGPGSPRSGTCAPARPARAPGDPGPGAVGRERRSRGSRWVRQR